MIHMLGKVAIEDLEKFVGVFATRGAQARKKHGCSGSALYRISEEENRVLVLFEWESREAFEGFLSDTQVKETMKSSGTSAPPEFTILEVIGKFPS